MLPWDDSELTLSEQIEVRIEYYRGLLKARYQLSPDEQLSDSRRNALAKDQWRVASLIEAEQESREITHD